MIGLMLMLTMSASPLLRQTFDDGTPGWIAGGKGGSLRVAREAADVKNGTGALAFDYTIGAGMAIAALPLRGVDTAHLDAIRFWVKTDMPTALAVVLSEKKPGGNYTAICWSTGNTWQQVELKPSDFSLSDGPNDPADPDGKLDVDALENIGLLDMNSFFGARVDPNSPFVVEPHAGKHTLFVDDFELWTGSAYAAKDPLVVDDFSSPQLQWLTRGGAELRAENGGMRAIYQMPEEQSIFLLRNLSHVDLRGKEWLAFDVSSEQPVELIMTFEMRVPGRPQGARYNASIEVEGGGKVNHREVLLSVFGDGQGELPPIQWDKLKNFSIVDVTAQTQHGTGKNSLWIGNIRAVDGKADQ
jgi:hypothetical protein